MQKKSTVTKARERAKEKVFIGILLLILPSGVRALNMEPFNLDLDVFGAFIDSLSLVGLVLLIIGMVGLSRRPKS